MMPRTHYALSGNIRARAFEPPNTYQSTPVSLGTRMDQAHWAMCGSDSITIRESFEKAGMEAGSLLAPVADHTGRREGVAHRPAQRRRNPAGTHDDAAAAGRRTETVAAMRVPVVEDDAIIGTLLAELLAGIGHDVCGIEATEADAVSAAARCKPDLMIADVGLGEGSGVSTVETIQLTGPIPHVFVSSDVSGIRAFRLRSIFIQKPYRESVGARAIQQALDTASIQ